jgi:hypothetical protein
LFQDVTSMSTLPGHGDKLSRNQERAIAALLTSPTTLEAAQRIGVHFNTLRNWLRLPCFAEAYREARQEILDKTLQRLQHSSFAAVNALVADLGHENPDVRFRAAELLLQTAVKGTEVLDVARHLSRVEELVNGRLAAMEQALAGRNGHSRQG